MSSHDCIIRDDLPLLKTSSESKKKHEREGREREREKDTRLATCAKKGKADLRVGYEILW
jgi:hypothetical protein